MFAVHKAKHNMCDYSDDEKENRRPLTEFEMKARRSLHKMSVTNWFLKEKSANPKVLKSNTLIECLLKPWKKGKTEKSGKDVRNLRTKPTLGADHPADTHKMKRNFDEPPEETKSISKSSSQTEYLETDFSVEDHSSKSDYLKTKIFRKTCSSEQEPAALETITKRFSEKSGTIQTKNTRRIASTPTRVPEELPTAAKPATMILSDTTSSDYYTWKSETSTLGSSASESSVDRLLVSKKKSTELQKILRETKTTRNEKGLVKKIVEELNKGNKKSVDMSYHKPQSRNSVKKLVDAFEKQMNGMRVEDEGERKYSDEDINSAAACTSISYEISDSESEGSLTISKSIESPVSGWKRKSSGRYSVVDRRPNETKREVYWIPVHVRREYLV